MTDVEEIDPPGGNIKFVKHTIIADTYAVFRPSSHSIMLKRGQPRSHLVNFVPNGFLSTGRKLIELLAKSERPDLQCRGHSYGDLRVR